MQHNSHGFHILEAAIGLFFLTSVLIAAIATVELVRRSFTLSEELTSAMYEARVEGMYMDNVEAAMLIPRPNVTALKTFATTAVESISKVPAAWKLPYFAEVKTFEVSVDTATGAWDSVSSIPDTTMTKGDLALPLSLEKVTSLDTLAENLLGKLQSGGFAKPDLLSPQSGTAGLPAMGGAYRNRSVISAARVAIDLGDTFSGRIWKSVTGSTVLTSTKVLLMRGDLA